MKNYNKNNCDCFIREVITDKYGRQIILSGQFAFEWSITIFYTKERAVKTTYSNGSKAREVFRRYKRKRF